MADILPDNVDVVGMELLIESSARRGLTMSDERTRKVDIIEQRKIAKSAASFGKPSYLGYLRLTLSPAKLEASRFHFVTLDFTCTFTAPLSVRKEHEIST